MAKKTTLITMVAESVKIEAAEGDSGPKKFSVIAYTGQPVNVRNYDLPVVVDLEGLTYSKSIVANLDHDQTRRVGHVTEKHNDGKTLTLGGFASAATPSRDEVIRSASEGFVWQASIEATPTKLVEIAANKSVSVNGQTFQGPLYVARKTNLRGFAFVSHGADDNTSVTIAASAAISKELENMDPKIVAWAKSMGIDVDNASDEQLGIIQANYEGLHATKKERETKKGGHRDVLAELRAEQDREEKITAIVQREARGRSDLELQMIQKLADDAIEMKWEIEHFELELYRSIRPLGHTVFRARKERDSQLSNDIIQAALCQTGGLSDLEKKFDERTLEAAHQRFPNGIGLKQLICLCAIDAGYRTDCHDVTLDVQRAAFQKSFHPQIQASGFSTLSIPNILSATANKFLLEGWMSVDSTWRTISAIRSVRDFKTVNSYSLTGSFEYEKVGPGGELKHGTVGEETYTNKADTYGKMFAITRTDIINDDLGALTAVPRRLGRGAALKFNSVFWTEFLDNSSFFASGNNNVSTGAGSALGDAGLSAAEVKFLNQTDPNSQPLGLMPAILLVPPTLKHTALKLVNSSLVIGSTTANSVLPNSNIWEGRFRVASAPYMENSSYTGYSTAAWYLLANPIDMAVIESCFLNGRESPVVETADAEFSTLGIQMRGYHDFGVNTQEPRAGVRSAGS